MLKEAEKDVLKFDAISITFLVVSVLLCAYNATYGTNLSQDIATKSFFLLLLLFGGLVMHIAILGLPVVDWTLSPDELTNILVGILVGFVGVGLAQTAILSSAKISFEITPSAILSGIALAVIVGTCEEVFFRGFLQQFIKKQLGSTFSAKVVAVVLSAAIFATYHILYSGEVFVLIAVFFSGIILGIVMELVDCRISIPMAVHILVDAMVGG
jgi:membrane protease YdiL (CAAX protease family)